MVTERFPRPVICSWCGNKHRLSIPDHGDNTLGDACATDVWQVTEKIKVRLAEKGVAVEIGDWMANGHFGANWLDCTLWKWVQNFPTTAADPVCDNCIGERICANDLIQIEGQFP